jgi:hypothetical protein
MIGKFFKLDFSPCLKNKKQAGFIGLLFQSKLRPQCLSHSDDMDPIPENDREQYFLAEVEKKK